MVLGRKVGRYTLAIRNLERKNGPGVVKSGARTGKGACKSDGGGSPVLSV